MTDETSIGSRKKRLLRLPILILIGFLGIVCWITLDTGTPAPAPVLQSRPSPVQVDWPAVEVEVTQFLSELLQVPSVNPPGNEKPAAELIAKTLRSAGLEAKVIQTAPGRALVTSRIKGKQSEPALCLASHIDVVPAVPKFWSSPELPFSGKVKDGVIYGRGALDMKGFVAMQVMTMILIKRHKIELERDLVFLGLPDEEGGGKFGAEWVVKNRPDLVRGVHTMWNEGSIGLEITPGKNDKNVFGVMHAERGCLWIELSATGPGGHGSTAPPGNAPSQLFEAVQRILNDPEEMQITPIAERMFMGMSNSTKFPVNFALARLNNPVVQMLVNETFKKDRFLRAVSRNTRNLTCWEMGRKVNVVPAEGKAKIDIRLLPGVDPKDELKRIKALIADLKSVKIRVISESAGSESPIATDFYDLLSTTVLRLNPNSVSFPFLSPGGTDSASFRPLGIHCYGLMPTLCSEQELKTFHGANERIRVKSLTAGTRATFEVVWDYCTRPDSELKRAKATLKSPQEH